MIRNYLGFPRGIGGSELAQRGYEQAWAFSTRFLVGTEVTSMDWGYDAHLLRTDDGRELTACAVVLAMRVAYRRLEVPSLERLAGLGVFYGASPAEAKQFENRRVHVIGAGNSAGQAALHFAKRASHVTIVVRGDSLEKSMSTYLIDAQGAAANVEVLLGSRVIEGRPRLLRWASQRKSDIGDHHRSYTLASTRRYSTRRRHEPASRAGHEREPKVGDQLANEAESVRVGTFCRYSTSLPRTRRTLRWWLISDGCGRTTNGRTLSARARTRRCWKPCVERPTYATPWLRMVLRVPP
jgi:thioredoxin reductase